MTGVLGNASAVLSHARATIPAIKADYANLFNRAAPPKTRAKSAAALAAVALIVAALGYAVHQEWQIHIIYETEITKINVDKVKAESCRVRLASITGAPDFPDILSEDDPDALAIVEDCKEYINKGVLYKIRRRIQETKEAKRKAQEEAATPQTYDECLEKVTLRHMVAKKGLTYDLARQDLLAKGQDTPEIAQCMETDEGGSSRRQAPHDRRVPRC